MKLAIAAGAALGVLYTLSPLTVLCLAGIVAIAAWMTKSMSPRERGWFVGLLLAAVALRLAAIAALFLFADPTRPYANFFGDEELFKNRTVWLRNVSIGIPISPADTIYVFDEVGRSSYLYLLAYIQALVGDAPYGANVLNACWYVSAVLLLHWFMRRAYGRVAAMGALVLLLFLPSLFSWSVSVLKEPLYMSLAAVELICAVQIVRAPRIWQRLAAIAAVIGLAYVLDSVRVGGWMFAMVGSTVGVLIAMIYQRPRLAAPAVALAPVLLLIALWQPAVQTRVLRIVQEAAFQHWGHVATPGYSYKLLDPRFYRDARPVVYTMTAPEAGRYVIRALGNFVTVPRPSQVESRAALAYLPEQAIWYVVLALVPIGAVAGFRRDPVVTSLLLSHGLAASVMVALTGGNIGTLIRHRGLTLPYFSWLAALGACHVVHSLAARRAEPSPPSLPSGEHA